jgi:hypothetical protein
MAWRSRSSVAAGEAVLLYTVGQVLHQCRSNTNASTAMSARHILLGVQDQIIQLSS